ncbi:MAG: replication-relaxation family protein [Candidatus Saccharimonadales bacterium]
MTQPLPTITTKQQELIRLLYRHRFLSRKQVQFFMHHTDKRRISSWLKDLRQKQYIEWIYQPDDLIESTKPAIYYLGLNGIRLLRQFGEYSAEELRKRYTESSRKRTFIDRCLLLADCCINMEARSAGSSGVTYTYTMEADYADRDNEYYFLNESEFVHPSLCYLKEQDNEDGLMTATYLAEILDATTPRYMVKKKLKDYVDFLDGDEWEKGTEDSELPIILIACPTLAELIYAKRYIRKRLEDIGQEDNEEITLRLATTEQVKKLGITGKIWEDI